MHDEYNGDGCAILTEMIQSDICVEGTTDKAGPQMDMDKSLLPDMPLDNMDYTRVGWYWTHGYKAIKSANIIIAINKVANIIFTHNCFSSIPVLKTFLSTPSKHKLNTTI